MILESRSTVAESAKISNKEIDVTSLILEEGEHPHEYQFHLDQEAGQKNFELVKEFLKQHKMK